MSINAKIKARPILNQFEDAVLDTWKLWVLSQSLYLPLVRTTTIQLCKTNTETVMFIALAFIKKQASSMITWISINTSDVYLYWCG